MDTLNAERYEAIYEQRKAELHQMSMLNERIGAQPKDVKEALAKFRQFARHCPCPMWVKDDESRMLAKNAAYAEIYGDATEDEHYIGRTDNIAWDEDTAQHYQANDSGALQHGYHAALEPIYNGATGRREMLWVIKWVWELADGTVLVPGMVVGNLPQPECSRRG